MESSMAINDFVEANEIARDGFGNVRFEALVDYISPARRTKVITQVKITRNGICDGDIDIDESDDLIVSDYHLGLKTQFQTYSFNDGSLLINGTSPKMGGKYTITISVFK